MAPSSNLSESESTSYTSNTSSDITTSTTSSQRMRAYFLRRKEQLLRVELAERIWQRQTSVFVVIILFVAILAIVMVIIYGGIQPSGLVLSVHKITVDTSKTNRPVVDPLLTTQPPTTYSTPKPIRGTVKPISKWGPYDRYRPRIDINRKSINVASRHNEVDKTVENWAKKVFNFGKDKHMAIQSTTPNLLSTTELDKSSSSSEQTSTAYTENIIVDSKNHSGNDINTDSIRTFETTTQLAITKMKIKEIDTDLIPTRKKYLSTTVTPINYQSSVTVSQKYQNDKKSNAQIKNPSQTFTKNNDSINNPPANHFIKTSTTHKTSDLEKLMLSTLDRLAEHYKNYTK